jgi:tryptophan 2,3-dioxygenase
MIAQEPSRSPCYYADYLRLSELLSLQVRESERIGRAAHDEMLFIVVHQAYGLWFKQILHELDAVQAEFAHEPLADESLGRIVHALDRINEILKLLVHQLDVLETMTPLDFLDFRDLLIPASGFQSVQFRTIEIRLGLKQGDRLPLGDKPFEALLAPADRERISRAETGEKLIDQLDRWLARTPFVEVSDYAFRTAYREAVVHALEADARRVRSSGVMSVKQRDAEAGAIDQALDSFRAIFAPQSSPSPWRMSAKAVEAALFITVYRDEPVLQLPFRLLAALMDVEETLTLWRYRHALMVRRMIGVKVGTGGSSGHDYLRRTAEQYQIFGDLFALASYLIPRSALPPLPPAIKARMGFTYTEDRHEP